jgi:S-DNA-T family DNA segregation ATPase FtsK/SpoIIIE
MILASIASTLLYIFGCSAFFLSFLLAGSAYLLMKGKKTKLFILRTVSIMLSLSPLLTLYNRELFTGFLPGGYWGISVVEHLNRFVDPVLMTVIIGALFGFSLFTVIPLRWYKYLFALLDGVHVKIKLIKAYNPFIPAQKLIMKGIRKYAHQQTDLTAWLIEDLVQEQVGAVKNKELTKKYNESIIPSENISSVRNSAEKISALPQEQKKMYILPSVTLFETPPFSAVQVSKEHEHQAELLQEKLKRFGIVGTVTHIIGGPVVTLFEYKPHINVKISKILALEDDLALALKAVSLRIIAPIPGKSVVGFEVANNKRQTIYFAEVFARYTHHNFKLPLIIGQDARGKPAVIDLTDLPHLLIAGSTGSGKSGILNTIIMSLLCTQSPEKVKLILIDPKRLEFAPYEDCSYLLFPIVTDVLYARKVLFWALKTMEDRYARMAEKGVRNIHEYHARGYDNMPFMVIIVDEIADLLMTGGKEIEDSLIRLAQMARACGIHLIIATQRPSVEVITGLMKVNFPARLACKVASKIDSRTILDCTGAEKLLGKGDMLFLDQHGMLNRMHGALVSSQDIQVIVNHSKQQVPVCYEELACIPEQDEEEIDILFSHIVEFVKQREEISISLIQQEFRIGYNRSARIINLLEQKGYILPAQGTKRRRVLR